MLEWFNHFLQIEALVGEGCALVMLFYAFFCAVVGTGVVIYDYYIRKRR